MSKILCVFAMVLIGTFAIPLDAQQRTILDLPRGEDAVLWQTRSCVGEVGWRAPDETCAAMAWIHAKRAKRVGVSLTTMIRAYSVAVRRPRSRPRPTSTSRPETVILGNVLPAAQAAPASHPVRPRSSYDASTRRRWVQELTLTGSAPDSWPVHLRRAWPRYQARLREIHGVVERVVAGQVEDPCPDALHYGGPMDSTPRRHEPDPACSFSDTAQVFYRQEQRDGT